MKGVFFWRWMISFLLLTLARPCPKPPGSRCHCEAPMNLFRTCYSAKTNEEVFRCYQGEKAKYLTLWCRNKEYLDDFFDMPFPNGKMSLHIDHCSFTEKWAENFLNSNISELWFEEVNYLRYERNKALFRMLPSLRELTIVAYEFNMTNHTFEYLSSLHKLVISSFDLQITSRHPFVHLQNVQILDLSQNKIKTLPDSIFHDLPALNDLSLGHNELETLPENLFVKNRNLLSLVLSNNKLTLISQNLVHNARNLRALDISDNPLRQISNGIFSKKSLIFAVRVSGCNLTSILQNLFENLTNLQYLYMDRNKLNSITSNYFKTNRLLLYINLSFNEIPQLIDSPFQFNINLERIFLKGNKLENITRKDFFGLKSLKTLDISHNLISDIEETSLQDLKNLLYLHLNDNRLKFINVDHFKANILLKTLNLSSNEISMLYNSPFQFNTEMTSLFLNENKLSKISRSDFSGLTSLGKLDIRNNALSDIEEYSFEEMSSLYHLDISKNFLREIPHLHHPNKTSSLSLFIAKDNNITEFPNMTKYGKLKELHLEGNQLSSLSVSSDSFLKTENVYIYLQNNSIKSINVDSVKFDHDREYDYDDLINNSSLRKKMIFHIEGNPLICDCDLHEFSVYISRKIFCLRRVLFSDAHKLICRGPQNLKGEIMHQLRGDAFLCAITEKCPPGCNCKFRKSDSAVIVHCDGLEMNALPEIIPEDIRILHIKNNNLKGLIELKREEWENLTELYVDGNQLSSKNSDQWYIPRGLRVLSLTRNNLNILPEQIKLQAKRVKDFQLYLRNNSWKCDCSGAELRHWIHGHVKQVKDMAKVFCMKDTRDGTSPTFFTLINVTHNFLCPFDHSPFIRERITGASSIFTLGFISVACVIFYNMNKRKLLSYIYIHFPCTSACVSNQRELDEDKIFDAFLSYCSDDRDVAFEISNELEKKEPYYRLCIHERDWLAGDYIIENIVSSVKSSKKTILILSKGYLESHWCDFEFNVAYNQTLQDKTSRLILIVKGDLPLKNTGNDDLRFMLATKTYMTWGEDRFWEKLRSALPYNLHD